MKTYKIILSEKGKNIYKGGNVEVLKPILNETIETENYKIESQGLDIARSILYDYIMQTLGSGSFYLFDLEELKGGLNK
jgi:hypothetical protein